SYPRPPIVARPPPRPGLFPYTTLFRSRKRSPKEIAAQRTGATGLGNAGGACAFPDRWWNHRPGNAGAGCSDQGTAASTSISRARSEEHTSELQSPDHLVCRLLLEKKNY